MRVEVVVGAECVTVKNRSPPAGIPPQLPRMFPDPSSTRTAACCAPTVDVRGLNVPPEAPFANLSGAAESALDWFSGPHQNSIWSCDMSPLQRGLTLIVLGLEMARLLAGPVICGEQLVARPPPNEPLCVNTTASESFPLAPEPPMTWPFWPISQTLTSRASSRIGVLAGVALPGVILVSKFTVPVLACGVR